MKVVINNTSTIAYYIDSMDSLLIKKNNKWNLLSGSLLLLSMTGYYYYLLIYHKFATENIPLVVIGMGFTYLALWKIYKGIIGETYLFEKKQKTVKLNGSIIATFSSIKCLQLIIVEDIDIIQTKFELTIITDSKAIQLDNSHEIVTYELAQKISKLTGQNLVIQTHQSGT